jgi:hypothetical protein
MMFSHNQADRPSINYPMTISAVNAAISLSQPGVPGKRWLVHMANWRVSGTAAVGSQNCAVTIKADTTAIYQSAIPAGSTNGQNLSLVLGVPLELPIGAAVSFNIASPNNANCGIYANLGLELRDA